MKQIKAIIHRNRVSDVVHALKQAGFGNLTVLDVTGMLQALDAKEQRYSVELGGKVIAEIQLELVVGDDAAARQVVELIREHARTGQPEAGWIYVSEVVEGLRIDG